MRAIFKYYIELKDDVSIWMKEGAKVLCVQVQNGKVCLWALTEPEAPDEVRHFKIFGTGQLVSGAGKFIGTVQTNGGSLVFHVFEAAQEGNTLQ